MNNKGFTLIETILVVAILALITIILVPSVTGLITKNKNDSYNNMISSIEKASSLYVSDNRYDLALDCSNNKNNSTFNITLQTLIDAGDLKGPTIINPKDKSGIDLVNNYVIITFDCKTKQFSYDVNISN